MKIVVVSPHPDDETLGAGGLILKRKNLGDEVYWINITDAEDCNIWDKNFIIHRKKQIENICRFYRFDGFYNLKFQPSNLENENKNEVIKRFGECLQDIKPEWLILPNYEDAHSDHRVVFEVGMICSKIFRAPTIKKILMMEILSETEFSKTGKAFSPNYFVDISEYIDKKIEALKIYDTEISNLPFPRSVEAVKSLAILRGCMAGCLFAESYKIVKEIE